MTLSDDLQEHPIRAGIRDLEQERRPRASRASRSRCATSSASRSRRPTPSTRRRLPALPRAPPPAPPSPTASRSASAARCARRGLPRRLHPRRSPAENEPDARVSPGERYARIYEINMARCIFCGYCEVDVPVRRDHARKRLRALRAVARRARSTPRRCSSSPRCGARPRRIRTEFDRGAQEIEGAGVLGMYHVYSQNHDEVAPLADGASRSSTSRARAAIGSAIAVVVQRNPFLAALSLILHLASLSPRGRYPGAAAAPRRTTPAARPWRPGRRRRR